MVRVAVRDIDIVIVRPKITERLPVYVILVCDDYDRCETIWVDAPKFRRDRVEEEIKKRFAALYGVKPGNVEVTWLVEPPTILGG